MKKTKRFLCLLLSAIMLAGITAGWNITTLAANSGDFKYGVLEDGTAEITGYTGSATNLIIPAEIDGYAVTSISYDAFWGSENLAKVEIPQSVTAIGNYAFAYCEKLTNITLPNGVESIGGEAFSNCKSLRALYIPASVVFIDECAFINCYSLSDITVDTANTVYDSRGNCNALIETQTNTLLYGCANTVIPDDIQSVAQYAFCDLKTLRIPASVTHIDSMAFSNCTNLQSIVVDEKNPVYDSRENCNAIIESETDTMVLGCMNTHIPTSVSSIGSYAFYNCQNLKSITIPQSVTYISNNAFEYSGLQSITIPDGVDTIGNSAFAYCSDLKEVTLPKSLSYIESSLFDTCKNLTGITIPDWVTSIESNAFSDCTSLSSLVIPESVTSIDYNAFENCSSLVTLKIPAGLVNIDTKAFSGCSGLKYISVDEKNPVYDSRENCNAIIDTKSSTLLLGGLSTVIPDGIIRIGDDAFSNATTLVIPESVTSIGEQAFAHCDDLTEITFLGAVDEMGDAILQDCNNLKTVVMDHLTSIGKAMFSYCDSLTDITIPEGVQTIKEQAFEECENLTHVQLPQTLVNIKGSAFLNCSKLTDLIIPKSVTHIEGDAFYSCDGLTELYIPENLIEIDNMAFANCRGLEKISVDDANPVYDSRNQCNAIIDSANNTLLLGCINTSIPDNIACIGGYAFSGCNSMTSVKIPDSVTKIVYGAFQNNTSLVDIEMPDHFVSIEAGTFSSTKWYDDQPDGPVYLGRMLYSCKGAMDGNLVVKSDVLGISSSAFKGQSLTSVSLPEGLQIVGASAFFKCPMQSVYIPQSVTSIEDYAFGYTSYWENDNPNFTIYGYAGTEAERYANDNGFKFVALSKPTDTATGISVVPAYADSSLPENAVLTVKTLSSSSTYVSYDISLSADGQAVQPDGAVAVKIPVPAGMDGAACKVYRAETDGTYTDMNAAYADGYLTFTTDHFSEYVVTTGDPADVPGADLLGDVDGNGMVNAADAVMVLRSDAGLITLTPEQTAAADVTGDGIINASDAVQILRFDAGLITQF